jgi:hypothetical protein
MRVENTFRNDFPPVEETYTYYTDSAAAGTTLQAGRKTDWPDRYDERVRGRRTTIRWIDR